MNHATTHKYYSYESWLRICNPELFLILTRGPFLHPLYEAEKQRRGRAWVRLEQQLTNGSGVGDREV